MEYFRPPGGVSSGEGLCGAWGQCSSKQLVPLTDRRSDPAGRGGKDAALQRPLLCLSSQRRKVCGPHVPWDFLLGGGGLLLSLSPTSHLPFCLSLQSCTSPVLLWLWGDTAQHPGSLTGSQMAIVCFCSTMLALRLPRQEKGKVPTCREAACLWSHPRQASTRGGLAPPGVRSWGQQAA